MKSVYAIVLLISLVAPASSAGAQPGAAKSEREYDVYSAYLRGVGEKSAAATGPYVVFDHTEALSRPEDTVAEHHLPLDGPCGTVPDDLVPAFHIVAKSDDPLVAGE